MDVQDGQDTGESILRILFIDVKNFRVISA
jgi:hypothetical protein